MTKNRSCGRKRRHATEAAAKADLWNRIRAGMSPGSMRAYKCRHCDGGWHVGHLGKRARREVA